MSLVRVTPWRLQELHLLLLWRRRRQVEVAVGAAEERVGPKVLRGVVDAQVRARLAIEGWPGQHAVHRSHGLVNARPSIRKLALSRHILQQQVAQLKRGVGVYVQDGGNVAEVKHCRVAIHCNPIRPSISSVHIMANAITYYSKCDGTVGTVGTVQVNPNSMQVYVTTKKRLRILATGKLMYCRPLCEEKYTGTGRTRANGQISARLYVKRIKLPVRTLQYQRPSANLQEHTHALLTYNYSK